MLMLISIFVSTFFSVLASLCFFCDFFLSKIYFSESTVAAFMASVLLCFRLGMADGRQDFRIKADFFLISIFVLSLVYFLFPSLPTFFPIGLSWDGANHIALMNRLKECSSHAIILKEHFNLPWGGGLYAYPWGMHAVFAGLAKLFHIEPFFLIHPVLALLSALMVASMAAYLRKHGFKPYAILATLLVGIFSPFIFFRWFRMDHWSQLTGTFLGLSLIYFLDFYAEKEKPVVLPFVLMIGILMIYPLFAAVFLPGMVYVFLKRKYPVSKMAVLLMLSVMTVLSFVWLSSYAGIVRRVFLDDAWPMSGFKSFLTSAVICLFASLATVYLVFRKHQHCFVFSIVAILVVGILKLPGLMGICSIKSYFLYKFFFLCLILLAPCFCFLIDWFYRRLQRICHRQILVPVLILSAVLFAVILPRNYLWFIPPAVTKEEIELTSSVVRTMASKRIFYAVKNSRTNAYKGSFKNIWLQAIFPKLNILFLSGPSNEKILFNYAFTLKPPEQIALIRKYIRLGDYLMIHEPAFSLGTPFRLVKTSGEVVLWEFHPKGEA